MAYDDDQARRSRVVVETPTSRREVTQTETYRDPERNGISGATVGVIVVVAIALITVVVLFLMNGQQNNDNNNLAAQQAQQPPVIVQQPAAQQPPVIIQQPATTAQQPPVIINQPAPTSGSMSNTSNDGAVQTAVDRKISDEPALSSLGITATVLDGKVTITGTVASETLKTQVDRVIRAVKGVKQVDNQLVVSAA